jgi:toxin secretion/phage lysis holin
MEKAVKYFRMDDLGNWLGGAVGLLVGAYSSQPAMLRLLIIASVVDYLSGVAVALCGKSMKSECGGLSSKVGFLGIVKKCSIFALVYFATLIDQATGQDMFQTGVCFFYFANEGLSVIENLKLLGVPIPAFIMKALEIMRTKNDTGTDQSSEDGQNKPTT